MRAHIRQRLEGADGFTLVELITVMAILSIILLGLTTSMVSGMHSEVTVANRQAAQANARLAIDRLLLDAHCANSFSVQQNAYGGFTLTLNETPGICPSVISSSNPYSGVQWCTIPVSGNTLHFQLFRQTSGSCDGVNTTLVVDYITRPPAGWPQNSAVTPAPTAWDGNLWPTPPTCSKGTLPRVPLDLGVNPDPTGQVNATYELKNLIALRNAPVCS